MSIQHARNVLKVCSSWVWKSRATTKRSWSNPLGSSEIDVVRRGAQFDLYQQSQIGVRSSASPENRIMRLGHSLPQLVTRLGPHFHNTA